MFEEYDFCSYRCHDGYIVTHLPYRPKTTNYIFKTIFRYLMSNFMFELKRGYELGIRGKPIILYRFKGVARALKALTIVGFKEHMDIQNVVNALTGIWLRHVGKDEPYNSA